MTDEPLAKIDPGVRRAAIVHDLSIRLRPVCADWPNELFESMIEGLAEVTMKYEGTASPSTYDRRTTDRLVADLKAALERSEHARDDRSESD